MNEIIIESFKSVGKFTLGASLKDIEKKFGKAEISTANEIMKNITELREAQELVFNKSGRGYVLDSVRCLKDTTPILDGINIFEVGLEGLKAIDNDFIEGDRYTTFRKLGISVGGFGKKKVAEKKVVIAFRKESLENFEIFAQV